MIEVHDMERYKDRIRKYAVRLDDLNEGGSGFLFAPENSCYVYIFTALHVVIKMLSPEKQKLRVDWDGQQLVFDESEVDICTLFSELEQQRLAQLQKDEVKKIVGNLDLAFGNDGYSERHKDIAVLRLPRDKFGKGIVFEKFPRHIDEKELSMELPFLGLGYPNKKTVSLELEGKCKRWNREKQIWDCQAVNMEYQFVESMKGFSGTGLVVDYQGILILAGIVACCDSGELHQCFYATGVSEIIQKMKLYGWEIPERFSGGSPPENFGAIDFKDDLRYMQDQVRKGLHKELYKISNKCIPGEMSQTQKFYDVPVCTDGRIACPFYWRGRFWSIFICKILNGTEEKKYYVSKDGVSLGLEFICTEGNGKADIATVVASAIRQNVLGNQIKGNCILIWQSLERPDRDYFTKKGFKNIVENIAEGNTYGMEGISNKAGYDLMDGEMRDKNYGIFHVKYLLSFLEECETMDEVKDKVMEVLEHVWK